MGTKYSEATIADNSYEAFLQEVQGKPSEFISGGYSASLTKDKNSSSEAVNRRPERSTFEAVEPHSGRNEAFELSDENNPFEIFLKETDTNSAESMNGSITKEKVPVSFMDSFLVELVRSTKNALASIYHATLLTVENAADEETRKHSHIQVKEGIQKLDSILNSLLNFININTPIVKANTLYVILEEVLEANEKQLREKNIKIIKNIEKDLPETYIHNEQVRFILHSLLQYVIFSTQRNESIGVLMKAFDFNDSAEAKKDSWEKKRGYVEVVVGFDGDVKLARTIEDLPGLPENQRQPTDVILVLVNEILTKNRGSMAIENNGKRPKTLITLRFPIERRNVVYYEPITL